jgi:hypothetical protein
VLVSDPELTVVVEVVGASGLCIDVFVEGRVYIRRSTIIPANSSTLQNNGPGPVLLIVSGALAESFSYRTNESESGETVITGG